MSESISLDVIGLSHGTDKASLHHNYLNFYEQFFRSLRFDAINILEVGVLGGASLRTWKKYFPRANIVGVDINPNVKGFVQERISIELLDQSNVEELTRMAVKHGPFDIIIEDGSHFWEHQITSLRTLFPFVKENGLYIVEDLQTNYGDLAESYKGIATVSCVEYLKSWVDIKVADDQFDIDGVEDAFLRTYGRSIEFITFYRRACLIKKQFKLPDRKRVDEGGALVQVEQNSFDIKINFLAHLGGVGDVFGSGFLNSVSNENPFQGLEIYTKDVLQYRVLLTGRSWSDWVLDGAYAGTRGESLAVEGLTVRLREEQKGRYDLRVIGRFAGHEKLVDVTDGEDCVSPHRGKLCGFQIQLRRLEPV